VASEQRVFLSRKRLFRWHGWIGLNLGLLLFVVCFSGTVAVFAYELDWLLDPALRVEASAERVDWTAVYEGVRTDLPFYQIGFVMAPRHPGFAATVLARGPAGRWQKLYLHPETGELLRAASYWNVQRFLRSFHRRMFVPNPAGIVWVSFFSFVLFVSAATGVLFFKRWYRHLLRIRWWDRRLRYADLHRLAGVWVLPFAAVMVLTGVWYLVELVAPAPLTEAPGIPASAIEARGPHPTMLPLGEQVRIAQEALAGLRPRQVIPGSPWEATRVQGQADAWLVRPRANEVRVDPVSGEVLSVQRASEVGLYRRWSDTADPLHFGTFGGLWTQVLWFALGLVLSSSMLTGAWLWHRRTERHAGRAGASPPTGWSHAAAGLVVVALLASSAFGVWELDLYQKRGAPPAERLVEAPLGPWRAVVVRRGSFVPGGEAPIDVYLESERGTANPQRAVAGLRCDGCSETQTVGASRPLAFSIPLPESVDPEALDLELRVGGGGRRYAGRLPLYAAAASEPVRLDPGPPSVPGAVWAFLGVFLVCQLGVVATWLYFASRVSRSDSSR